MRHDTPLDESEDLSDPTRLTASQIAGIVRTGGLSAVEVVRAHLDRISLTNPELNALILTQTERALESASDLDRRAGGPTGALAGVPFVVKDNIDVAGQITACGSRAHSGHPARIDAPVVRRLVGAGAVLLGRANMDEVAMGASTQTSACGTTRNPVDPRRSPGGSSGGCAAAVAAGMAAFAVGTDTGGSIREPASQCGVVGLAPSPGLVTMDGVAPFAVGLDRVGPLARTIQDVGLVLGVMAGRAPTRAGLPDRVAVVEELVTHRNQPDVLAAFEGWLDRLRARGVHVERVSLPDAPSALSAYMHLTSVAALDWLGPWVATGHAGPEVLRRAEYGRSLLAHPALTEAEAVRSRLVEQVQSAQDRHGLLVSPTMPTVAPLLDGETTPEELTDPMAAPYTDCWTVVANLAGVPAISVPAPSPGLPIGAMVMAPSGSDSSLLALVGLGS